MIQVRGFCSIFFCVAYSAGLFEDINQGFRFSGSAAFLEKFEKKSLSPDNSNLEMFGGVCADLR